MDFAPSASQEAVALAVSTRLERDCSMRVVRKAEPLGFDPTLWAAVVLDLEPLMTGGLVDAALCAEPVGRALAPIPFAESVAASRLLHRLGRPPRPGSVVSLAPTPATGRVARLVPAGAVADAVVVLVNDQLVLARPRLPRSAPTNLGSAPLADVDLSDAEVLASGPAAVALHRAAADEWRVLTAALLSGLGYGALDLAVQRVRTRHQFGVPIGSFQAVQHRLADLATALDGAQLLAREAAWAADEEPARATGLAAMALVFCGETAQAAATESLHFHGGYGFTLEFDVQLYFRRAKAWSLLLDDPAFELLHVADCLYGPVEHPSLDVPVGLARR